MSTVYRFVDPLVRQQTESFNAFLAQKQADLLDSVSAFLEQIPEAVESVRDLHPETLEHQILYSPIFSERFWQRKEYEIGTLGMHGFHFAHPSLGGRIRSIEDVRIFLAEHPEWIIETDSLEEVSPAELEEIVRENPPVPYI